MNDLYNYLANNGQAIIAAAGATIIAARLIVKLTPTPKDDGILDKVVSFLKHIGLHIDSK